MARLTRRLLLAAASVLGAQALSWSSIAKSEKRVRKVTPLKKEHRQLLEAIPSDPPPKKLVLSQHYLTSNEYHPERFRELMKDLGGLYIGVGAEQNYFYAGWSRPDILILLDFDQMVVDLHGVYRAFFLAAKGPKGLIDLWWFHNKKKALKILESAASGPAELKRLKAVYRIGHKVIRKRLVRMRHKYKAKKVPSFLTDQHQYDYIVAMLKAGRVRAVRGDLTKDKAMNGVAKAAKKLGVSVRCVYLSNVEMYFDYKSGLRKNVHAQPTDDKTEIIRTIYDGTSKGDRYAYLIQKDTAFRNWTKRPKIKKLADILKAAGKRIIKKKNGVWIVPGPK